MVSALESKAQLAVLMDDAADTVEWTLRRSSGVFESRRLQLLDTVPDLVGFYSEGSAALAADFYDDARTEARADGRFTASPVVLDRTVRIRRGVAWASEPLSIDDEAAAIARLVEVMRGEVSRPYRDTVLTNRRRDPAAVGWRRLASASACGFCKMLAGRGTVYKQATAGFGAHENCGCTAAPVFGKGDVGPEASAIQYMASRRQKTPSQRAQIRDYIEANFPDELLRKHTKVSH